MSISRLFIGSVFALSLLALASQSESAESQRSKKAIAEFKRENPCPANDKKRGSCPGYVIDHIEPICAGGADAPINMQWQMVKDAKSKDRDEKRQCAKQREKRGQR